MTSRKLQVSETAVVFWKIEGKPLEVIGWNLVYFPTEKLPKLLSNFSKIFVYL
jgi:hypothetical protein